MAYVIAEPCIGEKNTACVDVCPVNCIHSDGEQQYYIDPNVCIDCGACSSACPVNAIFLEKKLPKKWKHYAEINRNFYLRRAAKAHASASSVSWCAPQPQTAG
jgi:ferredoxin